jgi:uncharacterized protein YndB with AHSA1/START domain
MVLAAVLTASASAEVREGTIVRLDATAEIGAPPADVWRVMTTGKNLVTWCPMWKSSTNEHVVITKVGDVLDFTDEWGNGGRSVVTYCDPGKELRIAHEPSDGSYVCQARLVLASAPAGTVVTYVEQYTDDGDAEARASVARTTHASMEETLEALRGAVERR